MDNPWPVEDRLANLEQRITILDRMVKVSRILASTLDLNQLLEVILQVATEFTETEAAAIILLDRDTGELHAAATSRSQRDREEPYTLPLDGSIAGWVLTNNQPIVIRSTQDDPRIHELAGQDTSSWPRSMIGAPLNFRGETIGVIEVTNRLGDEDFTDRDLQTLLTLATQAAIAIENARLFQAQAEAYAALATANHQLQEVDRLKTAFIGVITHELRTPFANLGFSLELLERYGTQPWLEEQREQLEQLKEGTESAKRIVDNLVNFATFLSKQGELQLDWLDPADVIHEALVPLRSLAESKEIHLRSATAESLPAVRGDRDRLSDAVYHLVHNAVKFTGPGGLVWVRCWAEGDHLRLEVQDTGIGISADKLPGLWEGFAQMADPLRRGMEGLGLGLALVRYIVRAHGGQVWAQSEEGVGSTFGFRLPVHSEQPAPAPANAVDTHRREPLPLSDP